MPLRPPLRQYRTWLLDSRRWDSYVPRPDDIIIATAPKCGTTWMQQIVSVVLFRDPAPRSLHTVSTWIERRSPRPPEEMFQALAAQRHRRFHKTHLPADGLPLHDGVKYIHVARDGRDVALSTHNHFTGLAPSMLAALDRNGLEDPAIGQPFPRLPAEPAAFFRLWLSTPIVTGQQDGLPHLSFFDLEASYWAERKRANFLLVHYDDLRADLDGEMRRVAAFLDCPIDAAVWPSLVQACSFAEMQAAGDALVPEFGAALIGGTRRFFNEGTSKRWRGVLHEDDLAHYQAKVREKLTPGLAAWLATGSREAGDPRTLPD